ncbi:hypothetical protein RFI_10853 [Reticulomyxa filosa]|uniref:CMP/dCMP-type deaminase domain-containing protein n=1 Tax=Reticulomyxa filosa TaxID=46433 RepID=X6NJY5_RETFI|nr:hypothetical protein RFI_10853 [Reticulomyxa filosa]|eukprot:ETO26286.1 hypothetical protein RFI_10853 [Reticulomyxa filosa]
MEEKCHDISLSTNNKNEKLQNADYKDEFMIEALNQARLALIHNEVPVGCVIVHNNETIIAKAHNQTNVTKNGTKHCEIISIHEIIQHKKCNLHECVLYVTVEPCIMCAAALSLIGIQKVFYGCQNNKFGGNGSVFTINLFNHLKPEYNSFQVGLPQNATPYSSVGGFRSEEAIAMLKKFYDTGNQTLPPSKRARRNKLSTD